MDFLESAVTVKHYWGRLYDGYLEGLSLDRPLFWFPRGVLHSSRQFRIESDADAASMLQFFSSWRHALRIPLQMIPSRERYIAPTAPKR
jgi:hypothetical protein